MRPFSIAALNLTLVACAALMAFAPARAAEAEKPILVFAAASLANALDEAGAAYAKEGHPSIRATYASSSVLASQIEAGAPADLFISADRDWMDHLARSGRSALVARVDLLDNRLVLIARAEDPISIAIVPGMDLRPALGGRRLAVGDPDSVPAGIYAKAALEKLGLWQDLAPKLARAENVRAALLYVARGECPLGIVYATDARIDPKVRIVAEFPADLHPPIVYPAALLTRRAEAVAFYAYLQSAAAAQIFERAGFVIPAN